MSLLGDDALVCVYCDRWATATGCHACNEYDGLMTVEAWERYTGEVWDG
jgi:hypothetical protein